MLTFTLADMVRGLGRGLGWTAAMAVLALVCGGGFGLVVTIMRIAGSRLYSLPARIFIEFFLGTPLLMQLLLFFFGLAYLGLNTTPGLTAAVVLTLYAGAHLAEIWRGCVESLPRGQWEAGWSLALGRWQLLRFVILPQALRLAVAPTVGFAVQLLKNTAVTSIIGFTEITKAGNMIANATFRPLLVYGLVAGGYFILCLPLSVAAGRLERTMRAPHSR
ncbi:MAG: amino acid ABC transporter permease [Planctomycetes bacterium]|nr:amino acid ABC transporter permease [Planctomycetota bacterium]